MEYILTGLYVIRDAFTSEWHDNWINSLRHKTLNVILNTFTDGLEQIRLQEVMVYFMEVTETMPVVNMNIYNNMQTNTTENDWKKLSINFVTEYDQFRSSNDCRSFLSENHEFSSHLQKLVWNTNDTSLSTIIIQEEEEGPKGASHPDIMDIDRNNNNNTTL